MNRSFKILSIDGGGLKGTFPASFLACLEADLKRPIADYFDLIAGTSTGGIIALGLGMGYSAAELRDFYVDEGPQIFPSNAVAGWLRHWVLTKHSVRPLREALEKRFGNRLLNESKKRLLIPSLNAETAEIYIYKTRHHPKLTKDWKVPAVEVALATSAAPSYFPIHESMLNIPFIDGGIWANNPVGLAAIEAITLLGQRPENIRILSIGCTHHAIDLRPRRWMNGKLGWVRRALDAAMSGQSGGSLGAAAMIVGHPNLKRVNPSVAPGRFELDRVSDVKALDGLGSSEARKEAPYISEIFLRDTVDEFIPCSLERS